jgi:hypothetical protein
MSAKAHNQPIRKFRGAASGMRNRIVHDYENVDLAVLWGTITKSLPILIESINALLASETESNSTLLPENENNGTIQLYNPPVSAGFFMPNCRKY